MGISSARKAPLGVGSARTADASTPPPEVRLTDWQFRDAMEHSGIGTAFVSLEGRWLHVNAALRDLLGYDEQELSRLSFLDLTHPDDLDADLEQFQRVLANEISAYQLEKRYLCKSGEVVWALLTVSLVRDEQQRPQYFISQVLDITERKAAELERQALTDRLTLATEAGGISVWDWDVVADKLTCDERMYRLYGLAHPGLLRTVADFKSVTHPDDLERLDRDTKEALSGERNYDVQYRVVHPSGEVRHLRGAANIARAPDGAPLRLTGVTWDTTALHRLASDAQAASEAKSPSWPP